MRGMGSGAHPVKAQSSIVARSRGEGARRVLGNLAQILLG